jgi:hypothetical protein
LSTVGRLGSTSLFLTSASEKEPRDNHHDILSAYGSSGLSEAVAERMSWSLMLG